MAVTIFFYRGRGKCCMYFVRMKLCTFDFIFWWIINIADREFFKHQYLTFHFTNTLTSSHLHNFTIHQSLIFRCLIRSQGNMIWFFNHFVSVLMKWWICQSVSTEWRLCRGVFTKWQVLAADSSLCKNALADLSLQEKALVDLSLCENIMMDLSLHQNANDLSQSFLGGWGISSSVLIFTIAFMYTCILFSLILWVNMQFFHFW
jgi:hypothetical protein